MTFKQLSLQKMEDVASALCPSMKNNILAFEIELILVLYSVDKSISTRIKTCQKCLFIVRFALIKKWCYSQSKTYSFRFGQSIDKEKP